MLDSPLIVEVLATSVALSLAEVVFALSSVVELAGDIEAVSPDVEISVVVLIVELLDMVCAGSDETD